MNWVILDGSNKEDSKTKNIGNILKETMNQIGDSYHYFQLRDMNILPCRSCGTCGHKTPGECAIDDEMIDIIKAIVRSKGIILLTPIVFGGYSSNLKKAMDKLTIIGLPLYEVKDGNLLHPMRYSEKIIMGIGSSEMNIKGEEKNFRLLLERNALNTRAPYHDVLTVKGKEINSDIKDKILNMLKEVPK